VTRPVGMASRREQREAGARNAARHHGTDECDSPELQPVGYGGRHMLLAARVPTATHLRRRRRARVYDAWSRSTVKIQLRQQALARKQANPKFSRTRRGRTHWSQLLRSSLSRLHAPSSESTPNTAGQVESKPHWHTYNKNSSYSGAGARNAPGNHVTDDCEGAD